MMQVRGCGPHALLLEVESAEQREDLVRRLAHQHPAGVAEVVPAARTVLLVLERDADADAVTQAVHALPEAPASDDTDAAPVTIEVTYDGPDLDDVAQQLGISTEEVVRRHTSQTWTCEFGGFLPGFGYLAGADGDLEVSRRDSPRDRIPAGSVALAAGWSAVYPSASPGGWQLIGRTDQRMFDVDRDPPALITAGTAVHFVNAQATAASRPSDSPTGRANDTPTARTRDTAAGRVGGNSAGRVGGNEVTRRIETPPQTTLLVEDVRTLALVEDLGRPGRLHLGVPPSGAADRSSLTRGNRLLGNADAAAGIEVLLGGLTVRAQSPLLVAVTGGAAAVTVDGAPAAFGAPVRLRAGQRLKIGAASSGLRCYLCIRGGVVESADAPRVLGSMSSDPTSGVGPEALSAGTQLSVGAATAEPHVGISIPPISLATGGLDVHATWGPRADWLTEDGRADIRSSRWAVSSRTDRVGVRLEGSPLPLERSDQLPSEGIVRGCIQVPPDGSPIVFLADHPTTGGYPVVAVLEDADTDLLAQAPPGTRVHLQVR